MCGLRQAGGSRLVMYKWQLRQRKSCLTQEELVKAYEGPDFDLADRYGEVRRTTSFTYMLTRWPTYQLSQSSTCLRTCYCNAAAEHPFLYPDVLGGSTHTLALRVHHLCGDLLG